MQGLFDLGGKRVAVIVSGGNIDVNLIARIIERGLVKTGRRARVRLTAPDAAGTLARVTEIVAEARANILEISHDRTFSGVDLGQTRIDLVLETHGFEQIDDVLSRLAQAGYATEALPAARTPSAPAA
jgi:threonine dehydratase